MSLSKVHTRNQVLQQPAQRPVLGLAVITTAMTSCCPANNVTQRNTTFMMWNLMRLARLLKDKRSVHANGNLRAEWEAGYRFECPNAEHR